MAQDMLIELHQRGIKLRLVDGKLNVVAPPGSLTPDLRQQLRLRRDELIALLRHAEAGHERARITPQPEHRYEPFPLTDIQHAYWVGRNPAVELGGVSTHFYLEFELTGIDTARLNQALHKVVERHDMLRAIIQPDGQQRILPKVPAYDMVVGDLRTMTPQEQQAAIAGIRAELGHQVLPADHWPLFDLRASQLDDERLRLHVSLDMLIMDALSVELMAQEWLRFYAEPDWTPQPLQISYRDYVLADAALRGGSRYRRAEEYWLARLDTLPAPPALPLATQPAQLTRTEFTSRRARVSADQWGAIKQAARRRGLTPAVVLMTAFADVLRMWSKMPSFTLNLTLFNRPPLHPQIEALIGDFTSVTMLAVDAAPDDSFAARVQRLRHQLIQDLEHVSYSGVRVLRERARRLGGRPGATMPVVFTSWLGLTPEEDSAKGSSAGFFGADVYGVSQTPQVWLDHQVMEEQGDLRFNWDAVEALFPTDLLDDMFSTYRAVLERLSHDDAWDQSGPLVSLPRWQAAQRAEANATAADIPKRTLCELVEEQAHRRPDALAVISADGQFGYRDIVVQARRLARRLVDLGATPNTLVGVVMAKGWEQVVAVLGVVQSGAAYLPIDPDWPQARRAQLLRHGAVRVVVTTPTVRDELTWPADVHVVTLTDRAVCQADAGPLDVRPSPEDLAYVIFTSGSTGQPKGVMIDHRGAANTIQDLNRRFQVGPADRVLALSALSFDLSVYDIFGMLAAGGTVVMPTASREHDPTHWTELVQRHGVTLWNSVPALMQAWLDASGPAQRAARSKLRSVWLSGDWIPVTLPDAIRARYPDAQVISMGGATEASIWSVWYPIGEVPTEWIRIPYGKPLANQTLHVYDAQLDECPVWTTGEIHIGGVGVAKGYWADPERTGERFIVHPKTNERLYRTGDLGRYLPDGNIEFLGREDFQVKLNGYRIELGEIATALRRQPGVSDALVGVPVNPATGRRQLVAYVIAADGQALPPDVDDGGDRWRGMVEAGEDELRQGIAELTPDLETYRGLLRVADELCPSIMARTLAQLGQFAQVGDTATAEEIVERCNLKPRYLGLVDQWLLVLAAEGLLSSTGRTGEYRCERSFDLNQLDGEVRQKQLRAQVQGASRVLSDYFASCAEQQTQLLRGEVSALALLLPNGGHVTEALYADNPVSLLCNRVAAQIVGSFARRLPGERPVRILEVGAGTGATTATVLPHLPADRSNYRFTDISTFFTERAKGRFREFPFVEYAVFDIDHEPATQGVARGSADVVIAANVMHDAKDLDGSLGYLRSVLAPGGVLVLIEGTTNSLLQMITVGFVEGFANHRGQRERAFLSVGQWREHLRSAGFAQFAAVPNADEATDGSIQHVLLAQAPAGRAPVDPTALHDALEELLPDFMVPRHYLLIDRLPLSPNDKVDLSALPMPWDSAAPDARVAPRDELERTLFDIWSDALGRDDFGVEDNFFELGGDSLHAVRILARLGDELGVSGSADAGLQRLFENPTIAALAVQLRSRVEP